MIRKTTPFFLFIAIAVISCSHHLGPKEVVDSFIQKLRNKDFEGARQLATERSKPIVQKFAALYAEEKPNESTPAEPRSFVTGKATITGNEAFVPVEYKKGDKTVLSWEMGLEKEKGKWKVVLEDPEAN
ncbi:MAG TPA: hypothetical protein VHM26_01435 [Chitinophagaceae bacterium]|jgi:hypothetical protein|nr:hypothetical protein [Chitinophagaceae bacterium]